MNNIKFLFIVLTQFIVSTVLAQETRVSGSFPPELSPIQVLTYQNPFENNVISLLEINSPNGGFDIIFNIENKRTIIFQSGDYTATVNLKPGVSYTINFKKGKVSKLASWKTLEVTSFSSNDYITNQILQIEEEIETIKAGYLKGNGRPSKKYANGLYGYLIHQLNEMTSNNPLIKEYTNSLKFNAHLRYIKDFGTLEQFNAIKKYYIENLEYSFTSLKVINIIYAGKMYLQYIMQDKQKESYFTYINNELNKIENQKLKVGIELALIANAYNFNLVELHLIDQRIQQFIDDYPDPILLGYAHSLQNLHNSSLIGSQLQNFELIDLENNILSFNDYEGKYLLLDFWATWCGPCVKSMKELPKLKAGLETELVILCISNDSKVEKMRKFVEKNKYNTSMDFAYARKKKEMNSYFDKQAIPLYYLVDPDGIIIDKAVKDPTSMIKKHLK